MNDAIIIRMENAEQLAMGQLELKVTLTVEKNYVYIVTIITYRKELKLPCT